MNYNNKGTQIHTLLLISITYAIIFAISMINNHIFADTLNSNYGNNVSPISFNNDNNTNTYVWSSQNFSLSVDKTSYVSGEEVNLKGNVNKVIEGKAIRFDVYGPNGNSIMTVYADPDNSGKFSTGFGTGSLPKGQYTIAATYGNQNGSIKFDIK